MNPAIDRWIQCVKDAAIGGHHQDVDDYLREALRLVSEDMQEQCIKAIDKCSISGSGHIYGEGPLISPDNAKHHISKVPLHGDPPKLEDYTTKEPPMYPPDRIDEKTCPKCGKPGTGCD